MKTLHSMPKSVQAKASALPHWPAPVSVARRLIAFHLVVVGLRHGRVRLVAARRAVALVLEVDAGRRLERLLQRRRPHQRASAAKTRRCGGTSSGISIHRSWLTSCAISAWAKIGSRSAGPMGCFVPGCSGGRQRLGQVGLEVVPLLRHLLVRQDDLGSPCFPPALCCLALAKI